LRARSVTRFYIAWPLSSAVMGALAGALMGLDGHLGLSGWQWLFVVEGLPAVLLGVVFFMLLPDGPATARWLTEPERSAVVNRQADIAAAAHGHSGSIGVALRDARVWLLGVWMFCMLGSGYAYSFSAPAIVQRLYGWSISATGFVIAALFLLGAAAMLINGILSDRARDPFRYVLPGCFMMSGGFLMLALSPYPSLALIGLLVIIAGHMSLQGPLWAISTSFLKGRSAAAGIAAMNTIGILGGFVGPYWMGIAKDLTGNDQRGLTLMALPMLIAAGIMLHLRRRSQGVQLHVPTVVAADV
jgi:ACS family tartrate transporter-like MFS transporter